MNLFRSEEHIRNWASFAPNTEEGVTPLPDMVKLFSGPYFRRRLDPDYVSHMSEYARDMIGTMIEIGKTGPFWKRPKP
ncbi:MAG: hypothetical protein HY788_09640 [Deltaproteobacteria bacterium]|nr:hypothetical protein [Deltaproteobacteria bacterium]